MKEIQKITCYGRVIRQVIFYVVLLFICIRCGKIPDNVEKTLELAGKNRGELQAVLNHYQATEDSLKLEAAYFLIGNMKTKYSYDHSKIGVHKKLLFFVDSIYKSQDPPVSDPRKFWGTINDIEIINKYWEKLKNENGNLSKRSLPLVLDIETITATFLIENIDYAFLAWDNPWAKHLDFEQFCNYILPYRNLNEPLEDWRAAYYKKYKDKALEKTITALDAGIAIYNRAAIIKNNSSTFREYPDLGLKDLNKVKLGTCRDQASFMNYVMRSQGIPISTVFLVHGTEWSMILNSDGNIFQFAGENRPPSVDFNYYRDNWKCPRTTASKFFEHSFKEDMRLINNLPVKDIPPFFRNPGLRDVTAILHDKPVVVNASLLTNNEHNGYAYLNDFHASIGWSVVDWSYVKNSKVTFPSVGSEKIYMISVYKNFDNKPVSDPFYLDSIGNQKFLIPDAFKTEKIRLYRKQPKGVIESIYTKHMIGCYIQVANQVDFSDARTIYKIKTAPDRAMEIEVGIDSTYKYIRYVSDKGKCFLAELSFFNEKNKTIIGKPICSSRNPLHISKNVFDGDIRTNYLNHEKEPSWLGMKFDEPQKISKIKYLHADSYNIVEPIHEYELLYWKDNSWVSLGRKISQDDYIDYDAPKNALLLLICDNEERQSMVFFMRNGEQIWG